MERLGICEKKAAEGPVRLLCVRLMENTTSCLPALCGSKALATSLQRLDLSCSEELEKISSEMLSTLCRGFCVLEQLALHLELGSADLFSCLYADPLSKVATTLTRLYLDLPGYFSLCNVYMLFHMFSFSRSTSFSMFPFAHDADGPPFFADTAPQVLSQRRIRPSSSNMLPQGSNISI